MNDKYRRQNAEVYYMTEPLIVWGAADLHFLKERAAENPRLRCRLCAHPNSDAPLHEMLIIHGREAYVRPHRHRGRAESFQVLEGEATAVFFDDDGTVRERIDMTPSSQGGAFFYRVPENTYHMLIIKSEWLVFYECTEGPFDPDRCELAQWSPDGADAGAVQAYIDALTSCSSGSTEEGAQP